MKILYKTTTYLLDLQIKSLLKKIPKKYKPKLMILGHGRHGKDTVVELLTKYGFEGTSSSEILADRVVFPALKGKYGYASVKECFEDRHNHRKEWYDLIENYAKDDYGKIGELIYQEQHVYCGLRDVKQLEASKKVGITDGIFWVDASERHPPEDSSSCTVGKEDAEYVIENNSSLVVLEMNVALVFKAFLKDYIKKINEPHKAVEVWHTDYSPKLRIFPVDTDFESIHKLFKTKEKHVHLTVSTL